MFRSNKSYINRLYTAIGLLNSFYLLRSVVWKKRMRKSRIFVTENSDEIFKEQTYSQIYRSDVYTNLDLTNGAYAVVRIVSMYCHFIINRWMLNKRQTTIQSAYAIDNSAYRIFLLLHAELAQNALINHIMQLERTLNL